MADDAGAMDGVTIVDLYAEYPDLNIDVNREQQLLRSHDVIVFLYPMYWYSTPAILKEWQDRVLEHGFAYGSEGKALHGKLFFNALSAGGPDSAYRLTAEGHFSLRELLAPMEQMARLCGMHYLPPLALFGSARAKQDGRIQAHRKTWRALLAALRDRTLDIESLGQLALLNHALTHLEQEG